MNHLSKAIVLGMPIPPLSLVTSVPSVGFCHNHHWWVNLAICKPIRLSRNNIEQLRLQFFLGRVPNEILSAWFNGFIYWWNGWHPNSLTLMQPFALLDSPLLWLVLMELWKAIWQMKELYFRVVGVVEYSQMFWVMGESNPLGKKEKKPAQYFRSTHEG